MSKLQLKKGTKPGGKKQSGLDHRILSAPDESNRNSSHAYFFIGGTLGAEPIAGHIHRLAGGRHPINHEKLAPGPTLEQWLHP